MNIFRLCFLLTCLFLGLFHNTAQGQKVNLKTLTTLCAEQKYEEAYRLVNSKSFHYKKKETEEYLYLYSFTCKEMYLANPEINSSYRNESILLAQRLITSSNHERVTQGNVLMDFLTTTIYNDVTINTATKTNTDSIMFGDFTTETIEAFEHFKVPSNLTVNELYFLGISFYNDAIFIMTEMIDYDGVEVFIDIALRSVALIKVSAIFFKVLCINHNVHCDTHKMILKSLGREN